MKNFLFITTLNFSFFFFSFLAITGISYTTSLQYDVVGATIGLACISYIFVDSFFMQGSTLRKINILFFILPVIGILIYFLEAPESQTASRYFSVFLVFSIPAMYIGTYVASNHWLMRMAKWWELTAIILTLGLLFSADEIAENNLHIAGALSYQVISYMASYAFSLNFFFVLFGDGFQRFSFTQSNLYNTLAYFMMFIQVIVIFVSGGRGGFVVLGIAMIILIILKFSMTFSFRKLAIAIFSIFSIFFLLKDILPSEINYLLQKGSARTISYITSGGLDFNEISGRDIVYSNAINLIKRKPILGYGIFKYVDAAKYYPHNIFLEFLLQGGIFWFSFWTIVFVRFYIKMKRMIKLDKIQLLVIPIIIYPFIQLMFSGSYLMSSLFWFGITYVFNFKTSLNIKTSN